MGKFQKHRENLGVGNDGEDGDIHNQVEWKDNIESLREIRILFFL